MILKYKILDLNQLAATFVLLLKIKGPPSAIKKVPTSVIKKKELIKTLSQAPMIDKTEPTLILKLIPCESMAQLATGVINGKINKYSKEFMFARIELIPYILGKWFAIT